MDVKSVDDAVQAAKLLLTHGPSAVIVTLGAKGAVLAIKDGPIKHIPVPKVTAVDTTVSSHSFRRWHLVLLLS